MGILEKIGRFIGGLIADEVLPKGEEKDGE